MERPYFTLMFLYLSRNLCNGQMLKRDDSAVNYVNFVLNPFQKLQSLVVSSFEASELSECTLECLANQNCYSVNFGAAKNGGGMHPCELLRGDMFKDNEILIAHEDFHHFNIKTLCTRGPCQNGGTCYPIYDRDDYSCACLPEYTGGLCEIQLTITITICENAEKNVTCSAGGKIQVTFANFGRLDNHTCPHHSHDYQIQTDCCAQSSLARVQAECQGKTSCDLKPRNAFFEMDPCPGIFKYLLVKYKCTN